MKRSLIYTKKKHIYRHINLQDEQHRIIYSSVAAHL